VMQTQSKMQQPHLQMQIQSYCQSRCMLLAAAGFAINRHFCASCLRGPGHFHKVANQAKASDISAGSGSMLLQYSGCLRTALLHAGHGTYRVANNVVQQVLTREEQGQQCTPAESEQPQQPQKDFSSSYHLLHHFLLRQTMQYLDVNNVIKNADDEHETKDRWGSLHVHVSQYCQHWGHLHCDLKLLQPICRQWNDYE